MDLEQSSFSPKETVDRCTTFDVGEETYVAFGDGEQLPYRSFIRKETFDLARPYLLSPDSTVTALDGRRLAGVTGAMLARQSRAPGTVVDVLVNEFLVRTPEEAAALGVPVGEVNSKKLDEIIERILIQYGDDSVQELECATVLFNSVSNLAAKTIEDRRLGGFIEQSSRYVVYSEKDPVTGRWMYLREPRIMASMYGTEYVALMDRCFALYVRLVDGLTDYYDRLKPLEEAEYAVRPGDTRKYKLAELQDEKEVKEFKRVHKFDRKTRACDTARVVLPASTLTNLAMVANGRTFEHLLKKLNSSSNPEYHDISRRLHATLNKIIPKYVKRADPAGERHTMTVETTIRADIREHFPELLFFKRSETDVAWVHVPPLLSAEDEGPVHLLAAAYYPYVRVSYRALVARLMAEERTKVLALLKRVVGPRVTRRDRTPRAFEQGYSCTFEVTGNYGIFRDLHRHRMLTQQRQYLNPYIGFTVPADVEAIGLAPEVRALATDIAALYDRLDSVLGPEAAQYCVLFGHHIRFMMGFDLREAQHFLELRTVPQGHPDYRRVCQKMADLLFARAPWLRDIGLLSFVDYNDYPWSRADAEARQSQKRIMKGITEE